MARTPLAASTGTWCRQSRAESGQPCSSRTGTPSPCSSTYRDMPFASMIRPSSGLVMPPIMARRVTPCPACCTSPRSWLTWSAMDSGSGKSGRPGGGSAPWPVRRLFPLLATVIMAAAGMAGTVWGPRFYGKTAWAVPDDLWGTLIAAQRLAHLDLAGLYTYPTQLVSLPGAAIILIPALAVIGPAGLQLTVPHAHGAYPSVWLFAGPYQVAISAVVLFAADAIAERLGATRPKRFCRAAASATALWIVTVRWGHPEDAVAVGLFMYAILALADSKAVRSAWLAGAAVAVQPLVLLAFPLLAAVIEPRRLPGFLARAATPGALLLAVAAAANWTATVHAVTSQPNYPAIDHPTPWIYLAPHLAEGQVAAGPGRVLAIAAALGCALR